MLLVLKAQGLGETFECKSLNDCSIAKSLAFQEQTEHMIVRETQANVYLREIQCSRDRQNLPSDSHILALNPFIDQHGLLRVGCRLRRSEMNFSEKHPLIIPGKSHIAKWCLVIFIRK